MLRYYILPIKKDDVKYFTIWVGGEKDWILNNKNRVLLFQDYSNLESYMKEKEIIIVNDEPIKDYDFDYISQFSKKQDNIKSKEFLDFWNLMTDWAYSTNQQFLGDDDSNGLINDIYNKLFYGCNLPVLKKEESEEYRPTWDNEEIEMLVKICDNGLSIIDNHTDFF